MTIGTRLLVFLGVLVSLELLIFLALYIYRLRARVASCHMLMAHKRGSINILVIQIAALMLL